MSSIPQGKVSKFQANSPKQRLDFELLEFLGLNNMDDPSSIDDPMSPDTLNTTLEEKGAVKSRMGYTQLLTTNLANATGGGYPFYTSSGAPQLIFASGLNLYMYNNAGGETLIGGPYANSGPWYFDEYGNDLYCANGTDALQQYNGSGITGLSGISPAPLFIKIHKNRLWYCPPNSSTIYFSNAGDPTTFPANNYIAVNTNDGQNITGFAVLLDNLIVFKNDSIWIVTGEPLGAGSNTVIGNLQLRQANSDVGCISQRTILEVENILLFAAVSGLYVFQNNQSKLISQVVNNTFLEDMNPTVQYKMYAVYSPVEKKYILGYADNTTTVPNKALVYDLLVKQFTVWDHIPGAWGIIFNFTPQGQVIIGDPTMGNLYQHFSGYADIAGYNGIVYSATPTTLTDPNAAWTTNEFYNARVQVGLGTSNVTSGVVISNTATTLTVASWSSGNPTAGLAYSIGGYNSYWKTKIFDFGNPEYTKRYKYWNIFADSENNYNLQVGATLDFAPLSYNLPPVNLGTGTTYWDEVGVYWDEAGISWDSATSLYERPGLPGTGRFIQLMFGNFNGNQPWRVFGQSITYKVKKARPSTNGTT